jgi:hypothetical protein
MGAPRVANDEIMEARLKDRDIATVQGRDPFGVLVNADHVVSKIGKTSTRDKPDIAAANHCDMHQFPLSLRTRSIIMLGLLMVVIDKISVESLPVFGIEKQFTSWRGPPPPKGL